MPATDKKAGGNSATASAITAKEEEEEGDFIMPLEKVEDIYLPMIFRSCGRRLTEQVQLLKELPMRRDDVLIVAYPKSGTHFSWEATSMLMAGKAESIKKSKIFAMLESTPVDVTNGLPADCPRVMNSHLPLRLLPQQVREKRLKVVFVYRNVKDLFVSAFFHYKQIPGAEALTLQSLEAPFFSGKLPYGSYVQYLKEGHEYRKTNPDVPVFLMSFEDMKEDPEKMVMKLAKFLGVNASPKLCKDIAEATKFKKMKEADKKKEQPENIPYADVYRKGEVGDWKNYLSVAQSERLEAAMKPLESCGYKFRYEL